MKKLSREDLWGLEEYAQKRTDFRRQIIEYKKNRIVHIGEHVTLCFEDYKLMHYQVQEMLHAERIFEPEGIAEELNAYNPLIPDGMNWKATMMIEYADADERRERLTQLLGIDEQTWCRVGECEKVYAISDEDLDRKTEDKTSAVHFLRFELTSEMVKVAHQGAALAYGCDHPNYTFAVTADDAVRTALVKDLD